jgi:large subunit ribosomal protein L22
VNKGKITSKKIFPQGRGHHGIVIHPSARMKVVLKEGKTIQEQRAAAFKSQMKKVVSAGIVREDKPLRNAGRMWGW